MAEFLEKLFDKVNAEKGISALMSLYLSPDLPGCVAIWSFMTLC
ncbi:hypothetical protein ACUUMB_22870 [Enterobacter kobei]